jgi:hypothetical protein
VCARVCVCTVQRTDLQRIGYLMAVKCPHTYINVHTCTHVCAHVSLHMCLCVYMYMYMYMHVHAHIRASAAYHTNRYIFTCVHIYIYIHMCVWMYVYVHVYGYVYIHTHMCVRIVLQVMFSAIRLCCNQPQQFQDLLQ